MKINFYVLSAALSIFFYFPAGAQNFVLGMEGGVSSRNFTNGSSITQAVTSGNHFLLGPEAGIFTELKYSNTFSLQPMVEYSSQGSKNGAFTTGAIAQGASADVAFENNNRAELNYLLIPCLAKFGWTFQGAPLRFFVAGGPFAGVLLSANQTVYDNAPNSANGEDVKAQLHNINAGLEGKMGLIYILGRGSLFIEGGSNYGLIKIQKAAASGGNYTGSVTFAIGYSFWFGPADYRTTNNTLRI